MKLWRLAMMIMVVAMVAGCMAREEKKPVMITSGRVNVGPAADYPAGSINGKFLDRYGIMISNSSGDVLAVRPMRSGEAVKWESDHRVFVSSSDGSKFDLIGRVVDGPAKKPLPAIRAERQADGTLVVDLTKLYGM